MSAQKHELFGHPRGLTLLFFTEMWERFSYYGMRAIFTLYMVNGLLFSRAKASEIYGSYTGLVYLTPLIGGYVADRYWGNRKSIIAGGLLMAVGQFLMFGSASMYHNAGMATALLWAGLIFLIIGNGFFKPNISSMIGQMYTEKDKRRDAAYTIFYMGINLGAFLAPLVCGFLGERYDAAGTPLPEYFKWGFLAAGVGMVLGTLLFHLEKNRYVVDPEGKPIGALPNKMVQAQDGSSTESAGLGTRQLLLGVGLAVALFLTFWKALGFDAIGAIIYGTTLAMMAMIITDASLSKVERDRIIVVYVSAFFVVFFWAAFEQAGASLTFFAEEQTQRHVGLNIPMWLAHLVSLGLLAALYWAFNIIRRNFTQGIDGLSGLLYIFVLGPALFLIYKNILFLSSGQASISMDDIPASYFQSINAVSIVILAPITAAIWVALAKRNSEPNSLVKQSMGLVILALGYVVIAIGVKGLGLGTKVSMFWLVALYVIHTIGELCLSPIGLSLVSKLSPMRFVSLLFGVWFLANSVANKAAGQLSALYPPSGREYKLALDNGIDEATYRGILEGQIQPSAEQIQLAERAAIPLDYPNFFGPVKDLYQFFLIFVVMAGVAGLILFLLSFPLKRMMHGAD
ncbi:MAG: peptide MFS transporter [Saprospirales bacterium]|nr:peptide MFS transporter [Saprospirales bacterium]MBK8921438.1 peptide MFS transporter [Saprospirales bacterium]